MRINIPLTVIVLGVFGTVVTGSELSRRCELPSACNATWQWRLQDLQGSNSSCSPFLQDVLCALHAPECARNVANLPCKDVCQLVRRDCSLKLSCHNFPSNKPLCRRKKDIKKQHKRSNKHSNGTSKKKKTLPDLVIGNRLPNCECDEKVKLRKKIYLSSQFHYAFRGDYKSAQHIKGSIKGGPLIVKMGVKQVLKHNKVDIPVNQDVTLWVEEGCMCPKLRKRHDYLILCYEEIRLNRLLFTPRCLAVKWRPVWQNRLKKWELIKEKKLRRRKRRRERQLSQNFQNSL